MLCYFKIDWYAEQAVSLISHVKILLLIGHVRIRYGTDCRGQSESNL